MSELKNTKLTILKQDSFAYNTPFNGLTFRLLQWRFATEILNENEAWFTGIGLNSSQAVLDAHYQKKGIYTGNPDLGDSGYLGYNFHNQYLETLVGTGVPGLLILLLIIFFIFFRLRSKLLFPLHVYLITTLFFFTESVLERQAGILFFCLIVFVFSIKSSKRNGSNPLTK
jgi:O-antigen ligase